MMDFSLTEKTRQAVIKLLSGMGYGVMLVNSIDEVNKLSDDTLINMYDRVKSDIELYKGDSRVLIMGKEYSYWHDQMQEVETIMSEDIILSPKVSDATKEQH